MIDTAFTHLLEHLQNPSDPTLWLADENALGTLASLSEPSPLLHIATNRYDVYLLAQQKGLSAEFNDFTFEGLKTKPSKIVYRVSKEKPLVHYLLDKSAELLEDDGELILAGKKQEGIKSYADNLCRTKGCAGKLKKSANDYYGRFRYFKNEVSLDKQDYRALQQPFSQHPSQAGLYSKPGVFGWNKIDAGTELLLECLPEILEQHSHPIGQVLDLGCGYGWIFANLHTYIDTALACQINLTATDNNAAAIACATKNAESSLIRTQVIADDCAKHIDQRFDLILCNPPFHQGFAHDKSLTCKFLQQTKQHLNTYAIAVFVMNEFVGLPKEVLSEFKGHKVIKKSQGFKVILLY